MVALVESQTLDPQCAAVVLLGIEASNVGGSLGILGLPKTRGPADMFQNLTIPIV